MRNITFDESSVLREFARIAADKGLVKVAQPAPAAPAPQPAKNPLYDEAVRLNELSAKLMQKYKGNMAAAKKELDQHILLSANKLRQQYGKHPAIDKFQQELSGKLLVPEMVAQNPGAMADDELEVDARTETAQVKQAKDDNSKNYDVSGETGEDLVEQAHPGGGTYTELTHSKTKENLVETIVEQQEADLAVARKAPKGTYATLMTLHNNLVKMGHEDKLTELKALIAKVATVEEVVGHTLLSLADKLDELGYRKAADQVDTLLKKKD